MTIEYKSNLYGGLVSLAVGIILILIIPSQIAADLVAMGTITSRTIPYIISAIFIICGVSLIFESVVLKRDELKTLNLKKEGKVSLFILCLFLYAIALKYSFLVSTSVLTTITLVFQGSKDKRYYAISIATVFVLYFVFKELLNVRLP